MSPVRLRSLVRWRPRWSVRLRSRTGARRWRLPAPRRRRSWQVRIAVVGRRRWFRCWRRRSARVWSGVWGVRCWRGRCVGMCRVPGPFRMPGVARTWVTACGSRGRPGCRRGRFRARRCRVGAVRRGRRARPLSGGCRSRGRPVARVVCRFPRRRLVLRAVVWWRVRVVLAVRWRGRVCLPRFWSPVCSWLVSASFVVSGWCR